MKEIQEAYSKRSKAPSWAVGLVFIITSGFSAATGTYLVIGSDIKQYMTSVHDIKMEEIKSRVTYNAEETNRLREGNIELSKRLAGVLSQSRELTFQREDCKVKESRCNQELKEAHSRLFIMATKHKP